MHQPKQPKLDRRQFSALLATAGAAMTTNLFASETAASAPETLRLTRNGWMPNNEHFPVLLYRAAFSPNIPDLASAMEAAFLRNGWPPQWRNGVYDFHHYHSTAHEVLGFAGGWGKIMLGGEGGHAITVHTGDVAVLPTGTGHCRLDASSDFLVIGAYPPGESWDICRSAPDAATLARMARVAFPASDPVHGPNGPLVQQWRS
jgi:uncharacterized protein YjlB